MRRVEAEVPAEFGGRTLLPHSARGGDRVFSLTLPTTNETGAER